ncbi:hypothetical protein [Nocardia sp. BMG111209]|uniref:hypothetical protein n=1 Tax=Nocardia sp. BMG111209 TaxID=1160137 RepID=UPI000380C9F6|nr:hypothetical protein [Nocardia sp. BMG111209]
MASTTEQTAANPTATDQAATDQAAPEPNSADTRTAAPPRAGGKSWQVTPAQLVVTAVIAVLLVATVVFGYLYRSARSDIDDAAAAAAADKHAEEVALNYAVGASTIDFHDTKSWLTRLEAGTTAQLAAKFDTTAPQLDQVLLPLQWTSTATPLSAAVLSESGGIYHVNAYLTVTSTNAQTPAGAQSTVTYALTLDRNNDWKITDVGGPQNMLPKR